MTSRRNQTFRHTTKRIKRKKETVKYKRRKKVAAAIIIHL